MKKQRLPIVSCEIQRRQALQIARRLGIRTRYKGTYTWNGRTLLVSAKPPFSRTPADLYHEIAHFQIAPQKFRHLLEYGLGYDPGSHSLSAPIPTRWKGPVNWPAAQEEEEWVSALGILWERECGGDYMNTVYEHSWDFRGLRRMFVKLVQMGFVARENGKLRPVEVLRT